MQTLSHDDASRWLQERSFPEWKTSVSKDWPRLANIEDEAAGRSMYIASCAVAWLAHPVPRQTMVFVYDPHVWPSSENLPLFGTWRKSLGAKPDLDDSPGHLFQAEETDDLRTLFHLSIIFGWGFVAAADKPQIGVHIDDDGHVCAFAEPSELLPGPEWLKKLLV